LTTKLSQQVREFHNAFDVPMLERPGVSSDEQVRYRLRLIAEEFFELLTACVRDDDWYDERMGIESLIHCAQLNVKLTEVADALADLDYVIEGARLAFGIDGEPIADEVHRSNMAKAAVCPECDGKKMVRRHTGVPDIQ